MSEVDEEEYFRFVRDDDRPEGEGISVAIIGDRHRGYAMVFRGGPLEVTRMMMTLSDQVHRRLPVGSFEDKRKRRPPS